MQRTEAVGSTADTKRAVMALTHEISWDCERFQETRILQTRKIHRQTEIIEQRIQPQINHTSSRVVAARERAKRAISPVPIATNI